MGHVESLVEGGRGGRDRATWRCRRSGWRPSGRPSVSPVVPQLAPVRSILGDGYSYEEIRLARMLLQRSLQLECHTGGTSEGA